MWNITLNFASYSTKVLKNAQLQHPTQRKSGTNAIISADQGHSTSQKSSTKVEYTTKNEQNKTSNTPNRVTVTTVTHSEEEKKAILHFNRDRRFTITE